MTTDTFLLLTPFLLLAVVALLGFIGCDRVLGLTPVSPITASARVFQQSANFAGGTGPSTASYMPAADETNLLVLISLHWGGSGGAQPKITVNGAPATQIESDTFNPQTVSHFFANNLGSGQIDISVGLTSGSNTAWDYCVAIYKNADQSTIPYNSPTSRQGTAQGTIPDSANQFSISASSDDVIYGVAISQSGATLGGNLAPGTGMTTIASPGSYFLVEDQAITTTGAVTPTAVVSGGTRWYVFAAEIKHA